MKRPLHNLKEMAGGDIGDRLAAHSLLKVERAERTHDVFISRTS
jgi:hypothetical protein